MQFRGMIKSRIHKNSNSCYIDSLTHHRLHQIAQKESYPEQQVRKTNY